LADTCLVVAPVEALGFRSLATNSAKMALYAPSHCGLAVRFGSLEQCLEAAVRGSWTAKGDHEMRERGPRNTRKGMKCAKLFRAFREVS